MKHKLLIGVGVIIALALAWYLISPAFISSELNEASPLDPEFGDTLDSMSTSEKERFNSEVDAMKDDIIEMEDQMDLGAMLLSESSFFPRAHDVKGRALLIKEGESHTLRFEDFETINGPNLHIYLATDLGSDDYVDLGKIKATKGNVNYEIPASVDLEKYDTVLVWCVPFRVLFSYAEL